MPSYGYNKDTDYQKLIQQDLEQGNYRNAAIHEAQRNEKIIGEGNKEFQTTSHYADYLPKTGANDYAGYGYNKDTDYQALINDDIAIGDYRSAAIHEAQRNAKIAGEGIANAGITATYSDYLPADRDILSGIQGLRSQKFEYNQNTDPAWQAYRKQFLREADRQTRDTMASYAGITGGVPSTAAVTAAQQAGNYQRSKLTDKIPELYQNAYSRYLDQQASERSYLSWLSGLSQQGFENSMTLQQYRDQQRQQALSNAMQRWSAIGAADEKVAAILGVPVGTPTSDYSYTQWQQQLAEQQQQMAEQAQTWQQQQTELDRQAQQANQALQQQQDASTRAYNICLALINAGKMPNDQLLEAAGLFEYKNDINALAAYNAAEIAANGTTGGGRGSSGGRKTGGTPRRSQDLDEDYVQEEEPMTGEQAYAALTARGKDVATQWSRGGSRVGSLSLEEFIFQEYKNHADDFAKDLPYLEILFNIQLDYT